MSGARVSDGLVGGDLINGDLASTAALAALCERVRPELACLGDAGTPLVAVLRFVEKAGDGRGTEVLADPGFALDVLTAADPGTDPALVGRVLDFLRTRNGADPGTNGNGSVIRQPQVTVTGWLVLAFVVADVVGSRPLAGLPLGAAGGPARSSCVSRRPKMGSGRAPSRAVAFGCRRP